MKRFPYSTHDELNPCASFFDEEQRQWRVQKQIEESRERTGVIAVVHAPTGSQYFTQEELDKMNVENRERMMKSERFHYLTTELISQSSAAGGRS